MIVYGVPNPSLRLPPSLPPTIQHLPPGVYHPTTTTATPTRYVSALAVLGPGGPPVRYQMAPRGGSRVRFRHPVSTNGREEHLPAPKAPIIQAGYTTARPRATAASPARIAQGTPYATDAGVAAQSSGKAALSPWAGNARASFHPRPRSRGGVPPYCDAPSRRTCTLDGNTSPACTPARPLQEGPPDGNRNGEGPGTRHGMSTMWAARKPPFTNTEPRSAPCAQSGLKKCQRFASRPQDKLTARGPDTREHRTFRPRDDEGRGGSSCLPRDPRQGPTARVLQKG